MSVLTSFTPELRDAVCRVVLGPDLEPYWDGTPGPGSAVQIHPKSLSTSHRILLGVALDLWTESNSLQFSELLDLPHKDLHRVSSALLALAEGQQSLVRWLTEYMGP